MIEALEEVEGAHETPGGDLKTSKPFTELPAGDYGIGSWSKSLPQQGSGAIKCSTQVSVYEGQVRRIALELGEATFSSYIEFACHIQAFLQASFIDLMSREIGIEAAAEEHVGEHLQYPLLAVRRPEEVPSGASRQQSRRPSTSLSGPGLGKPHTKSDWPSFLLGGPIT